MCTTCTDPPSDIEDTLQALSGDAPTPPLPPTSLDHFQQMALLTEGMNALKKHVSMPKSKPDAIIPPIFWRFHQTKKTYQFLSPLNLLHLLLLCLLSLT